MGIVLACLFFFIPISCLPPFRLGYYSQVETSIIAFWGLGGASSLWLYFLHKKNPGLVLQSAKLPLVWGPILLGLATALFSLFHPLPLRDFVGSGQIGEGGLTFIASGIMAAHFSIIARIGLYRKLIFSIAVCVGLVISALSLIASMDSPFISWRYWRWAPFSFPDFLAFIDIALLASYLYMRKGFKNIPYLYDILALSIFTFVGYHAHNKSLNYGLVIAGLSTLIIWITPNLWKRPLLQVCFFGLTLSLTLLVVFYDEFSLFLPESLKSLGQLSTLTSRTWLSKVTLVDLWVSPLNDQWLQEVLIGRGWGTFSNISAANMFLLDQVSLFAGNDYHPSWELIDRDLMHTHNIITTIFHSVGLGGISLYLYTQYKLINSLSRTVFLLGSAYLIAYQIQLLFWFQFVMTLPFTLFALSLLFRERASSRWASVLKPKVLLGFASLLLIFTFLQGFVAVGYKYGIMHRVVKSNIPLIDVLTSAPYVSLESSFGGQRLVGLSRLYSIDMRGEFEKSPEKLVTQSLRIVNNLNSLPKGGNILANTVAINILSELASNPETLKLLDAQTYKTWEQLAKDHITFMPYRSDILLPFFNLYQTLGKENLVFDLTREINRQNPHDSIALWFMGSSLLKNPSRFDEGMCTLQKALREGVERFMPIPPPLKSKIAKEARYCS